MVEKKKLSVKTLRFRCRVLKTLRKAYVNFHNLYMSKEILNFKFKISLCPENILFTKRLRGY